MIFDAHRFGHDDNRGVIDENCLAHDAFAGRRRLLARQILPLRNYYSARACVTRRQCDARYLVGDRARLSDE